MHHHSKYSALEICRRCYGKRAFFFFFERTPFINSCLADPGRDNALQQVYKTHRTKTQVSDAYRKVKNALKNMGDEYVNSKDTHNVLSRYTMLKKMVKAVSLIVSRLLQAIISGDNSREAVLDAH